MVKHSQVATLPVEPSAPPDKKRMRTQAPKFIQSVIEQTRALPEFTSLEQMRPEFLQPLSGGVNAAVYLLRTPKLQAILKFHNEGIEAEAEALLAWHSRKAHVPRVMNYGVVPATKTTAQPVKYLLQQALLDRHGRVVETCAEYLLRQPKKARETGRLMGVELKKMHSCVARRYFGDFADSPGSLSTYRSWNTFMKDFLKSRTAYLRSIGVTGEQLTAVERFIEQCQFVKRGRYIHGDFSIRNAAVKSHDPLQIYLFDPNPMIGDPTWDVANFYNNAEFQKRRAAADDSRADVATRDQQLLIGFRQGYHRRINQNGLLVSRLIQASLNAEAVENSDTADPLDGQVRREFIKDCIERIVRKTRT